MPKKQMELSYNILEKEIMSMIGGTGENILSLAFPKEQEKIQKFYEDFNTMLNDPVDGLNAINEKEKLDEFYELSSNEEITEPYAQGDTTKSPKYASEEAYRLVNDKVKEYTDYVKGLLSSPEGQEFRKKHSASASYLDYHLKICDDFYEGKNVYGELTTVPGAEWFTNNSVDYLSTMKNAEGQPVPRDLDGYDNALNNLHFPKITNMINQQREIQEKMKEPSLTAEEKNKLAGEQKSLTEETVKESKYLVDSKTVSNVSDFFFDSKTNLGGNRGAVIMKEQAEARLKALDQGWDPAYAQDSPYLEKISRQNKNTLAFLKANPNPKLEEFGKKAKAVADLDPSNRIFRSQAEFVEYYQAYSDALTELIEESKKPEVAAEIKNAEENDKERQFKSTSLSALLDSTLSPRERMNTSKYEHFAKQTNFRARGITAEGGKLVYNENKLDELNEEYKKINAIGEDINEKFTDFRSQLSAVKPVPEYRNVKVSANEIIKQNIPQEELVDTDEGTFHKIAEYPDDFDSLDLALKLAEYSEPETAGYDDIETNLKRVSRGANIYIKGHSGKVSSSDPDRENELKRRELAKQMKEYADSKLEELHKVNTKDLNVYRSANYQIEDLEETKELSSTFVKNSNEMKPEPVIDFNGIYDASQLLLFKNPVSSYLEEKNRDTEKNMLLFGEGIDTLQKMELQYTTYTTRQQHNKKQYAANYEQKKRGAELLDKLDEGYNSVLNDDAMKKMPGYKRYLEFQHSFIKSAKEGEDKFRRVSRLPDCNSSIPNPNLRSDPNGKLATKEDFDKMFTDLGFPKIVDSMDKSVELEKEIEGAYLTEEQKKDYAQKLIAQNNYRIGLYNSMQSEKNYELYGDYFKQNDDAFRSDIQGQRGVRLFIGPLERQNMLIENGWDISKLSSYNVLVNMQEECLELAEKCKESNDPKLQDLGILAEEMSELDPAVKSFQNQADFDAYFIKLSRQMKQLNGEVSKPEVNKALQDNHFDLHAIARFQDLAQEFIAETDIVNTDLSKYPPEKAEERRKEIKGASELADIYMTRENVKTISKKAAEHLKYMEENLDDLRAENSKYYREMKSALTEVANIDGTEWSIKDVENALKSLNILANEYGNKRKGIMQSDEGKKRTDFSDTLSSFAKDSLKEFKKTTKAIDKDYHDRIIDFYESDIKEENGIHPGADELKRITDRALAVENYTDTAVKTAENTKQFVDFFANDSKNRRSASDEYNQIIENSEFLLDPAHSVEYSSPTAYATNMLTLIESLDKYAELHSKALFGDRKLRADNAKAFSSQLKKDYETVLKSMKGLPYAAPTVASAREELQDKAKHISEQINSDVKERGLTPKGTYSSTLAQEYEKVTTDLRDPKIIATHTTESLKNLLKDTASIQLMMENEQFGPDYPFNKEIVRDYGKFDTESEVYKNMVDNMSDEQLVGALQDPKTFCDDYKDAPEIERNLEKPECFFKMKPEYITRDRFKNFAYRNGYSKEIDEKLLDTLYAGYFSYGDNEYESNLRDQLADVMEDVMLGKGDIEERRKKVVEDAYNIPHNAGLNFDEDDAELGDDDLDLSYDFAGEIAERKKENDARHDHTFEPGLKPEENRAKEAEPRHPDIEKMLNDRKAAQKAEEPVKEEKPAEKVEEPVKKEKPAEKVEEPAKEEKPAEKEEEPVKEEKPAEEEKLEELDEERAEYERHAYKVSDVIPGSVVPYQDSIKERMSAGAPKNNDDFIAVKIGVFREIADIIATKTIFPEKAEKSKREIADKLSIEHGTFTGENYLKEINKKMKQRDELGSQLLMKDEAFDYMVDKVRTWNDLQKVAKMACTKDGKGAMMMFADAKKEFKQLNQVKEVRQRQNSIDIDIDMDMDMDMDMDDNIKRKDSKDELDMINRM